MEPERTKMEGKGEWEGKESISLDTKTVSWVWKGDTNRRNK